MDTIHSVSVDGMTKSAVRLVENYQIFVKHAPALLRNSMMLAYQTAVDDMMKAMDHNKVVNPIEHKTEKPIVLLDQNGFAG
jgi:hypothetical protein